MRQKRDCATGSRPAPASDSKNPTERKRADQGGATVVFKGRGKTTADTNAHQEQRKESNARADTIRGTEERSAVGDSKKSPIAPKVDRHHAPPGNNSGAKDPKPSSPSTATTITSAGSKGDRPNADSEGDRPAQKEGEEKFPSGPGTVSPKEQTTTTTTTTLSKGAPPAQESVPPKERTPSDQEPTLGKKPFDQFASETHQNHEEIMDEDANMGGTEVLQEDPLGVRTFRLYIPNAKTREQILEDRSVEKARLVGQALQKEQPPNRPSKRIGDKGC